MTSPYIVTFPDTEYQPISIKTNTNEPVEPPLSVSLTLQNSPILFGCRTGICGTCLVVATGNLESPNAEEEEVLSILAPNEPNARLACQIQPTGDISITPLKP